MHQKKTRVSFKSRVLSVVSKIRRGETLTYKEVAADAGSSKAFRAVGTILSKNYDPKIPCHRVIRSDGQIGNYNRGIRRKMSLLKAEGAIVENRPKS